MAGVVYALCALTSVSCAILLLRAFRQTRTPLLVWSGACFLGLSVANVIVFLDFVVIDVDLGPARRGVQLASMSLLMIGLVFADSKPTREK